jgi:beta-lactamase class A
MLDRLFGMARQGRGVRVVVLVAALGVACSDSDAPTSADAGAIEAPGSGSPDAGAEPDGLNLPDTPVGRELAWLLDVINARGGAVSEAELREHFSAAFLAAVPPAELQQTFAAIAADGAPLRILQVSPSATDSALQVLADARGMQVLISVSLEAGTGLIDGLLFEAPVDLESGRPESWEAVDANVANLAPRSSYLVASVEGGDCTPLHAAASDDRLALGSAFKLYVLAELSRQIEAGSLGWDTNIVIRDELKSLPSGQLQDVPAGTELAVRDVATPMIAISDNTAADHLIDRLGRENVEAALSAFGHGAPERNTPFLSTREFFLFKLTVSEADAAAYLAADLPARRTFLAALGGQAPSLADAAQWVTPRRVDEIEWFASASELCRLMAALDVRSEMPGLAPIAEVLSRNPGLPIDGAAFPYIAFKGGSEPGVLNLTWLVHAQSGARYFVSIGLNDPSAPIADEAAALRTALGIFDLLAAGD